MFTDLLAFSGASGENNAQFTIGVFTGDGVDMGEMKEFFFKIIVIINGTSTSKNETHFIFTGFNWT